MSDEREINIIVRAIERTTSERGAGKRLIGVLDRLQGDYEPAFGSEIERAMYMALFPMFALASSGPAALLTDGYSFGHSDLLGGVIEFRQQAKIGQYRVDFSITVSPDIVFVVECDGHDFHEKTREQAQRDKARDRWFQTSGIPVLRFTGSEIWRDAVDCAVEVFEAVDAAAKRRGRR